MHDKSETSFKFGNGVLAGKYEEQGGQFEKVERVAVRFQVVNFYVNLVN
jgi:hypothetical protein